MFTLVNILILFFIFLILYQIFLATKIIEGMDNSNNSDYKSYDTNNPNNALILAQQNSGNIAYLKKQMDSVQDINQEVQDLSGNVQTLQTQVNGIVQAQQNYANQMTGGTVPNITGATDTDTDADADDTDTS
jgi:predicted PurR-regulated permease PerM